MIRVILILFLLINPANAKCKYYAEADVVNDVLVNKKEHYTCNEEEKDNFLIQFMTDPKFETSFITVVAYLFENL